MASVVIEWPFHLEILMDISVLGFFFFNLSCSHALAIIPAALPLAGITVSSLLTAVLGGD